MRLNSPPLEHRVKARRGRTRRRRRRRSPARASAASMPPRASAAAQLASSATWRRRRRRRRCCSTRCCCCCLGSALRRVLQRRSRARWRCGRAAVRRRACGEPGEAAAPEALRARLRRLRRARPSIRLGRCGGFGLCLRSRRGLGRCRPGCPCFVLGGRLRCSLCTAPGWRGVAGRRGRVLVRDLAEVVRGVLERAVHLIATLPPASTDGGRARRTRWYQRTALRRAQETAHVLVKVVY